MSARFGFKYKTRLSYEELEDIVAQYSRGPFGLHIGGLDETGGVKRKIMVLMFEQSEDRDRLKTLLTLRNAKSPLATAAPSRLPKEQG